LICEQGTRSEEHTSELQPHTTLFRSWAVSNATLSADGLTLSLKIPELQPTWGMEVSFDLRARDGGPVQGRIHNTIHMANDAAVDQR